MKIEIYIFCYNEEILIPHTIAHYKRLFPSSTITILDNMSTDRSLDIARYNKCKIIPFSTNNQIDEYNLQNMKNIIWKKSYNKWVIVVDMDEWIYINEKELIEENNKGTTILKVKGYNVVDDSKLVDLSDINLHKLHMGYYEINFNKNVCFKSGDITDINYSIGAHTCNPQGNVRFSDKTYILKHMDYMGLPYKLNKQNNRFKRSENARKNNMDIHYEVPLDEISNNHSKLLENRQDFFEEIKNYL